MSAESFRGAFVPHAESFRGVFAEVFADVFVVHAERFCAVFVEVFSKVFGWSALEMYWWTFSAGEANPTQQLVSSSLRDGFVGARGIGFGGLCGLFWTQGFVLLEHLFGKAQDHWPQAVADNGGPISILGSKFKRILNNRMHIHCRIQI